MDRDKLVEEVREAHATYGQTGALRSQPLPTDLCRQFIAIIEPHVRAETIEECARVAAEWDENSPHNSRASAIRALKDKTDG